MSKFGKLAHRIAKPILVAGLALLLSGCATLPLASGVIVGANIQGGLSTDYLYYSPPSPDPGAGPEAILTGFITAGTGPQNDYAIAREYLAEDFKSVWSPNDEVLIQSQKGNLAFETPNLAHYEASIQAIVTSDGEYSAVAKGTVRSLDFKLIKQRGQWRISEAPNLTLVIKPVFDVIFRSYSVYFFDKQFKYLVPDLRWFPSRASTGTRLVNAILDGPSPWLAPGVRSAVPQGTSLAIDAVTIEQSVAIVDLNAQALEADLLRRKYLKAQLYATLTQLSTVKSVAVQIDHSPQDIPDYLVPSVPTSSYTPVALVAGDLRHIGSGSSSSVVGAKALIAKLGATDFALSSDESRIGLLGPRGLFQANTNSIGSTPQLADARADLLAPSFDSQGYLWAISKTGFSSIDAIAANGDHVKVHSPWLANFRRVSFDISSDGTRAIFVVRSGSGTQLLLSAVVRDALGVPVSLSKPVSIVTDAENPQSVSWVDSLSIVVVDRAAGAAISWPTILTVGGKERKLASLNGVRAVAASNTDSSIYVLTDSGDVYRYDVYNWNKIDSAIQAVHFSG
jgi:hypothetical protein